MGKMETIDYLKARGMKKPRATYELLAEYAEQTNFNLFTVNGFDYMLNHFLNDSDQIGYGLVSTNSVLKTEEMHAVAIALVEGDDVVCINLEDCSVFLWLVQSAKWEWREKNSRK